MRHVLPPTYPAGHPDEGGTSHGEVKLFEEFQRIAEERGWYVLHSLNLPQVEGQSDGEVDFVVAMPGRGVLCVEVKASRRIAFKDNQWGRWIRKDGKDAFEPFKLDPFEQANRQMRSLINRFGDERVGNARVFFSHLVWFTHAEVPAESTDPQRRASQWRDATHFSEGVGETLERAMDEERAHQEASTNDRYQKVEFTQEDAARLIARMRPDFDATPSWATLKALREREFEVLGQAQLDMLEAVEPNERIVVWGAAGTGKSMLAAEAARRAAARGLRTLLVCYNVNLWEELSAELAGTSVTVKRIGQLIYQSQPKHGWDRDFRKEEWLEHSRRALEAVKSGEVAPPEGTFDVIVVDEAQDLLRENIQLLELFYNGGYMGHHMMFFGDFAHQNIYWGGDDEPLFNGTSLHDAALVLLKKNFRNSPRVGRFAEAFAGFSVASRMVRHDDERSGVRAYLYTTPAGQQTCLKQAVEDLLGDGFSPGEIMILSARKRQRSALNGVETIAGIPIRYERGGEGAPEKTLGWSTIHRFKGLEAEAIILTDLDQRYAGDDRLLYVGATRARQRLAVICERDSEVAERALGAGVDETVIRSL